ncbi:MAG: adenylyl-sulfate kinase [Verrucomicrobiota bacterium JB024]|nr:adenylyl-sulfate kinase [Verrucomicrobiota bacterium JB024]
MNPSQPEHLYPQFERMLSRQERETRLGQRSHVFWLYGLSGSGKSTLAVALEKSLFAQGRIVQVLDGDNIRTGLNSNLGFSDEDRTENIRRIAHVAKLYAQSGLIVITSFITPREDLRQLAREIIGPEDFSGVYVKASFEACAARDPKGLYAKVKAGQVKQFTGKDSGFEEPAAPELLIDTERESIEQSLEHLLAYATPKIVR